MLSKHWDHPSVYNMIYEASDQKRTHHIDTKRSYSRQINLTINVQNLYNNIQLIFLQDGSNRILSREPKSFVSCSHINCCLQKYTTHQFTYFIYCSLQDKFKDPKISKSNKYIKDTYKTIFYYFI